MCHLPSHLALVAHTIPSLPSLLTTSSKLCCHQVHLVAFFPRQISLCYFLPVFLTWLLPFMLSFYVLTSRYKPILLSSSRKVISILLPSAHQQWRCQPRQVWWGWQGGRKNSCGNNICVAALPVTRPSCSPFGTTCFWKCNQSSTHQYFGTEMSGVFSCNKKRKTFMYELKTWHNVVSLKILSGNTLQSKPLLSHPYFICTSES